MSTTTVVAISVFWGRAYLYSILETPNLTAFARYPFLKKHDSTPPGHRCVTNHCSCGAPLEDFYLQAEPDGGFFPMDEEEAAKIVLRELPASGPFKIKASFGRFHPDIIGPNARREPFEVPSA